MSEKKFVTADECVVLAKQFELYEQFDMALKYFRKAYEMDKANKDAEMGVERSKVSLAKKIYYQTPANYALTEGKLELRRGVLLFIGNNGIEIEHWLEYIENPRIRLGRLVFDYKGQPIEGYSCSVAKRWITTLKNVLKGKYPATDGQGLSSLEKYIHENFTASTLEEAVMYFMELSGCDSRDARIVVQRILG